MAKTQKTQPTFEQQFMRLEEIVDLLDRGELPLEHMMQLYEEGMQLLQTCHTYLSTTEQKIMTIQGMYAVSSSQGELSKSDFSQDELYL